MWSHFTRTLNFDSPSARDNIDATREISRLRNRRDMIRAFYCSLGESISLRFTTFGP